MSSWPHVGIVGGSLGGLTAALVLRDLGCEVDVFERSSEALKARGAGIATHPSTTRYFEESSDLDASLVEIELPWLQFLDAGGKLTWQERMNYRFVVVDHRVPRPHGGLRRRALPSRFRGRRLRRGRARRRRPLRGRRGAHRRHAGLRGRHRLRLASEAAPGRARAVRGLRCVAGDDPRVRPRAPRASRCSGTGSPTACSPTGTSSSTRFRALRASSSRGGGSRTSSATTTMPRATRSTTS